MRENSCFSLPPDAYLSPDLNKLEVPTIFEHSWLCAGREEDAPGPGDYETTWDGNWKLSAENSMEYYHHIGLHVRTAGVQMPDSDCARRRSPIRPITSSRRRRG